MKKPKKTTILICNDLDFLTPSLIYSFQEILPACRQLTYHFYGNFAPMLGQMRCLYADIE